MLLNLTKETEPVKSNALKIAAVIAGGLLLVASVTLTKIPATDIHAINEIGLVGNLGKVLFNEYVFPFEIASILFLSAMTGAIVLTKSDRG